MNAQSEIRQQIEKLYSQSTSIQLTQEILYFLKQQGMESIHVILDLAESADPQKKYFLYNLISELGNKKAIKTLRNLLENPEIPDETQLLMMMTIVRLGGQIDFDKIISEINNYEILCRFFALSALSAVDNPTIFEELIDQISEITDIRDELIWEELALIENDPRLVPLASALLDRVEEKWYGYLITMFENSQSQAAFPYLKELIQRTANKPLQDAARNTIFKIAQQTTPELEQYPFRFYKAFISSGDGDGSSICIFAVKTRFDSIRLLTFVLNDLEGIKEAFGLELPSNAFEAFIEKMGYGGLFEIAEVDAEYIFTRKELGEQLTIENSEILPTTYLVWRSIFNCECAKNPKLMRKPDFNALQQRVYNERLTLLHATPALFENIEIKMSWFLDFYDLEDIMNQAENPDSTEKAANISHKMDNLFDKSLLELLKNRLEHYAYVCFLNQSKSNARLALAAAQTLFEVPVNEHPFLKEMFRQSLNVLKNGFDLAGTGLEDTWLRPDLIKEKMRQRYS